VKTSSALMRSGMKSHFALKRMFELFTLKGGIKSKTDCKIKTHVPIFS